MKFIHLIVQPDTAEKQHVIILGFEKDSCKFLFLKIRYQRISL